MARNDILIILSHHIYEHSTSLEFLKSSQYCFIMFSVPVSHIFWKIYSYVFHTCCLYLFVANIGTSCLLQIKTILFLPFQSGCLHFFFSCLVSLAGTRTNSPMWNRSHKTIQPWFAPDLKVKVFNRLPFSMMLAIVLFCLFCFWRCPSLIWGRSLLCLILRVI